MAGYLNCDLIYLECDWLSQWASERQREREGGGRGCTWEIKGLQNRLSFTMGKGWMGGEPGATGLEAFQWSFEPFLFLISSVKLHVWLFFNFYALLTFSRAASLPAFVACRRSHQNAASGPTGSAESGSPLARRHPRQRAGPPGLIELTAFK